MSDQQTIINKENEQNEKRKKNRRLIFYILRIIVTGGIDWIAIKGLAKDHKILTIIVISFAILFWFAVLMVIFTEVSYYFCSSLWGRALEKMTSWFTDTSNICQHF
jgi:presenilin-like A22 family membrane protease